jgi:hypothetical protein
MRRRRGWLLGRKEGDGGDVHFFRYAKSFTEQSRMFFWVIKGFKMHEVAMVVTPPHDTL